MAAGLAARLVKSCRAEVELIESRGGAYEIVVDGELFYSKLLTGHFPNEDRIVEELAGEASHSRKQILSNSPL